MTARTSSERGATRRASRRAPAFQIAVLASGSAGNATYVSDGSTRLLVDAGLACREIERRLRQFGVTPASIDAVLLSHEHGDHAQGALRFARKHGAVLCATEGTFRTIRRRPAKPPKDVEWARLAAGASLRLNRLTLHVFATPHDAVEPIGFRFERDGLVFTHVTDIGHISRWVEDAIDGAHGVLVESNHDVDMLRRGPYPESLKQRVGSLEGHLSNEALARYLESRLPESVQHLFLAHLSQTNNHERLAVASCREALRRRGGSPPVVHLTYQDRPTPMLRLSKATPSVHPTGQGTLCF